MTLSTSNAAVLMYLEFILLIFFFLKNHENKRSLWYALLVHCNFPRRTGMISCRLAITARFGEEKFRGDFDEERGRSFAQR